MAPEVPVTAVDERMAFAHNSPQLVVDPENERIVVLASRTDNPDFGCELHASADFGRSWLPAFPVPKLPEGADKCYAPEVAFGGDGRLHYLFIALQGLGNNPSGAYLVTSKEGGYSPPKQVLGPERYMVRMAIDRTIGSHGRIHLVWLQAVADPPIGGLGPPPNPIMSAYSDDGGKTFSRPVQISDTHRRLAVAPSLALGPDGSVHVLYYDLQDDLRDYQGLEGPRWEGRWSLVSTSSNDGGRSFSRGVVVDESIVPPERVMLIYTMPPPALAAAPDGGLFAAWHDARNGDWDVFLRRSGDEGRSWGKLQRVNDDRQGNGRHQYLPRLAVSPTGRLDAIFLDRRRDPANLRYDVYYTYSHNGGSSLARNHRLTSEPSHAEIGPRYPIPSAKGLVETGSRIGVVAAKTGAVAAWTDARNSTEGTYQQDIFATGIKHREQQPGNLSRVAPLVAGALIVLLVVGVIFRARRVGVER